MDSEKIKVLIIEDDLKQARLIQSTLPDFFAVQVKAYSKAREYVKSDNIEKPDVVIMNADDSAGRSLDIYKYFSEDIDGLGLKKIPIVLMTQDEFSDDALEFYDYADPIFYSKDVEDADFYLTLSDAVETAKLLEDEDNQKQTGVKATTSPDKIMGMAFEVHVDENEPARIAAYSDKDLLKSMHELVSVNQKKTKQIWDILDSAIDEDEKSGEHIAVTGRVRGKRVARPVTHNPKTIKKKDASERDISKLHNIVDVTTVKHLLDEGEPSENISSNSYKNTYNRENVQNNGYMNMYSQNMMGTTGYVNGMYANTQGVNQNVYGRSSQGSSSIVKQGAYSGSTNANPVQKNRGLTVLIVDIDEKTKKACELFLDEKTKIVQVDSIMKAVDYFIKNTADVVLAEYDMAGTNGISIIKAIRMQPNGMRAKAAVLMDSKKSKTDKDSVLMVQGVVGIVEKPIIKKQLLSVVNKCLGK